LINELAKLGTDIGDYRSEEFYELCSQQYSAEELIEDTYCNDYGVKELPNGDWAWWNKDDEIEPYAAVLPGHRIVACPGEDFISYEPDQHVMDPYEDIKGAVVEKNGLYYAKLWLPSTNVVYAIGDINPDDYYLTVGPYLTYREALRVVWDDIISEDQKGKFPDYKVFDSYTEAIEDMWDIAVKVGDVDVHVFDTKEEAYEDCVEANGLSRDKYYEVYEHWIVTNWFGKKLEERGQIVKKVLGLTVWGRCAYNMSYSMDHVMWDIAYDMEILKGMQYDWSVK
jgi:hypothetical protein